MRSSSERQAPARGNTARSLALLAALVFAPALAGLQAQEPNGLDAALALEQTFVRAIADVEPSVVAIARVRQAVRDREEIRELQLESPLLRRSQDPGSPDFIPNEFGAGVIFAPGEKSGERLILTNYHVVRGGQVYGQERDAQTEQLYVYFVNRRSALASIIAADPRSDLAVLRVDFAGAGLTPADMKPIRFGDGAPVRKGQLVLAFGNPYAVARDGAPSVSWGIVGGLTRRPAPVRPATDEKSARLETIHHFGTLLQIDARLNLGTSGGPVVDLHGELVGIATSLAVLDGYEKSAGFAVPTDKPMRRIINELAQGHEAEYGFLGVGPQDVLPHEMLRFSERLSQVSAAVVESVLPGSPAGQAGIERDDLILEVNGNPVHSHYDLMRDVGQLPPDSVVELRLWRPATEQELTRSVKLGKWPVYDDEGIIATNPRYAAWRGLRVDYSTGRRKFFEQFQYFPAVVITEVAANSSADKAGLRVGDFVTHVGNVTVQSPAEFNRAVQNLQGDVKLRRAGEQDVILRE